MSPHPGSDDGEAKEHKGATRITVGGGISQLEEGKGPIFIADPHVDAGQPRRKKPGLSISLSDSTDSWEGFLSKVSMLVAQHRQLAYILAGVLIATGVGIGLVNVGSASPGPQQGGPFAGGNTRGGAKAITVAGLGRLISRQADQAVAVGALQTIATSFEIIPDHHLDFIVSRAEEDHAERKDAATAAGASSLADPFAEGQRDERLVVTDVGPDHVLMLNKFNTMQQHVLVVTKAFASQEGLLAASDLAALSAVVLGTPAVGLYNSGPEAGASQRHRHLQAVPLHVLQQYNPHAKQAIPMDSLVGAFLATRASPPTASFSLPSLPFRHRFLLLPDHDPATLEGAYHRLLRRVGCSESPSTSDSPASVAQCDVAYNLVLTPRWMLVVPRTQRSYLGVGVNALGFIGALLARGDDAMHAIQTAGPMTVLRGVSISRES